MKKKVKGEEELIERDGEMIKKAKLNKEKQ